MALGATHFFTAAAFPDVAFFWPLKPPPFFHVPPRKTRPGLSAGAMRALAPEQPRGFSADNFQNLYDGFPCSCALMAVL